MQETEREREIVCCASDYSFGVDYIRWCEIGIVRVQIRMGQGAGEGGGTRMRTSIHTDIHIHTHTYKYMRIYTQ